MKLILKNRKSIDTFKNRTETYLAREVSCRVTNSVLQYIESLGLDISPIIEDLPYSKEYLQDPFNWVSYDTREKVCQRAAKMVNDEKLMYRVGLATPDLKPTGGVEYLIELLGNPKIAYQSIAKYSSLFDRVFKFKTTIVDKNRATIVMSLPEGYPLSKNSCYYTQGMLAAIPTVWGLPPAEVHEIECMCQPVRKNPLKATIHDSRACVYDVSWKQMQPWHSRIGNKILRKDDDSLVAAQNKLEENFRLLDNKNAELVRRNILLAKVREIALSMEAVRTIDDVWSSIVELSRDIPGVRIVMVQELDQSGKNITTPYYSRIETPPISKMLKKIGFDSDVLLGKTATGAKWKYPVAKSKVAQRYLNNRQTLEFTTLAELADGVINKSMCNAIQKIFGFNKIVLVPLRPDGGSQYSLIFFLEDDVPLDILEMICAHCSIAITTVSIIESLERRNKELSALNTITRQTLTSLELNEILNNSVKEITNIFNADAAAIFLLDSSKENLCLAANYGMPKIMARHSKRFPIDNPVITKFLSSEDEIISGDLIEFIGQFPLHSALAPVMKSLPFATGVLQSHGQPCGLIQVVRRGGKSFTEQEQSLLLSITGYLSIAIENSDLHSDVIIKMEETERAHNKLKESEERFRLIADNANDLILKMQLVPKPVIEYVSPSSTSITGYTPQEFYSDPEILYRCVYPSDRERFAKFMQLSSPDNSNTRTIMRWIRKDGNIIWTEQENTIIYDSSGKPTSIHVIARDVTRRQETEIELKKQKDIVDRILSSTPNSVLVIDAEMQILLANPAFYKTFNLEESQIINRQLTEFIQSKDLINAVSSVLHETQTQLNLDYKHTHGNKEKFLKVNISSMQKGEVLIIFVDVTQDYEKQESLYLSDRLASVGEMASGIAHELNNPLTSIVGLSQLLTKEDLPEETVDDIKAIYSEAQRAAAIVKNLLTFARKHAPKRQLTQINKVLEDMLLLRAYEHKVNNIKVETHLAPDLPETIADYYQMQQVFLNIILNAESAMIEVHNRGTFIITTECVNNCIRILFTDDGPGIPAEYRERVFDPFFTTKEVGKGTGLGLSICYGIVTNHGGKITVESEPHLGTTFIIELPVSTK
jgi:PAS domain S-box-containing protein